MESFIVLLRGVNVGGHNRVPMKDLRDACEAAGLTDVRTYIQSGNLVLQAASREEAAAGVEQALRGMGVEVPVVACSVSDWSRWMAGNPFPDAAEARPNLLHLCVPREPARADAADRVAEKATGAERVAVRDGVLWVDYADGAGRSKITPTVLDRAAGSPVTARNWKTVLRLAEMAAAHSRTL